MGLGAERAMAIFIGFIMISSIAGFAMLSSRPIATKPVKTISHIVKGPLESSEIVFIIRTGRVLIRDWYRENCTDCELVLQNLESFAENFKDYVVLEKVEIPSNETEKLEIIGRGGEIRQLENITQENLMDVFCEIALLQPKECLLREV